MSNVETTTATEAEYKNIPAESMPDSALQFLWYGIKPNKWWFFLAVFLGIVASIIGQGSSYLFKIVTDAIEAGDMATAFLAGMAYPAIILGAQLLYRASGLATYQHVNLSRSYIYNNLTARLLGHSKSYFSDRFAGSLVNKLHNVARGFVTMVNDVVWTYINACVHLLVTAVLVYIVDARAAAIFVFLVVFLFAINKRLSKKKRVLSLEEAEARSQMSGSAADLIGNIDATRQYVKGPQEYVRISTATERVRTTATRSDFYTEYMLIINGLILFVALSLIMYFTLDSWRAGLVSSGDVVLVLALFSQISGMLIFIGQSFQRAAKAFGDMDEGLKEIVVPHEVEDAPDARELVVATPKIQWLDVTFSYEDNKVFDAFNLEIAPGERVGLVGPSGAGKTTFVSLLLRQHDLEDGSVLIDGHNIAEVTQDSLREHIAVVPQEPLLFHRTIRENIAYGKPLASDQDIIDVAEKAQAHEFIADLPDGYDTLVGERGVKLSGGQKQRVAIARAMLKDAPILVLDEATSALDSESEVAIQKALQQLMAGKTVVAIAHRLSTLREMDRIIVMEDGQVIENGSHDELAKAGGTYQRLWEHQAGGFIQE